MQVVFVCNHLDQVYGHHDSQDDAPDTKTSTERDNEGLKNGDCLFKKCHIVC